MRGKLVFVAINLRGGPPVRGGISIFAKCPESLGFFPAPANPAFSLAFSVNMTRRFMNRASVYPIG